VAQPLLSMDFSRRLKRYTQKLIHGLMNANSRVPVQFLKFRVRKDGVIIPILRRTRNPWAEGASGAGREAIPKQRVIARIVQALRYFILH
jgi:hypothetical protein